MKSRHSADKIALTGRAGGENMPSVEDTLYTRQRNRNQVY